MISQSRGPTPHILFATDEPVSAWPMRLEIRLKTWEVLPR